MPEFLKSLLTFLNGKKTQIGVVLYVLLKIASESNIPIPESVAVADKVLIGIGVAHKLIKQFFPSAKTAAPLLVLALCFSTLPGCASLVDKLPHAGFSLDVGALGASVKVGMDTRPLLNALGGALGGAMGGAGAGASVGAATPSQPPDIGR